jgi:hypothetical protein
MEEKAIRAAERAYALLVAGAQQSGLDVPANLAAFAWKITTLPQFEISDLETVHLRDHAGKRKWLHDRGCQWTGRLPDFAASALDQAAVYLLAQEAIRARHEADRLRRVLVGCRAA